MSGLAPLLRDFRQSLHTLNSSGVAPTGVPGVTFFWNDNSVPRAPLLYNSGPVISLKAMKCRHRSLVRASNGYALLQEGALEVCSLVNAAEGLMARRELRSPGLASSTGEKSS